MTSECSSSPEREPRSRSISLSQTLHSTPISVRSQTSFSDAAERRHLLGIGREGVRPRVLLSRSALNSCHSLSGIPSRLGLYPF
jgi:hypothetical protein